MEDNLIFKVLVQEGKGFSGEIQALCCSATFGDTTLLTPFSVGKERHVFNCPLTWATSKQQVRRLSAAGQNVCKVVVQKKDGSKLGWVVLDLRKAKLNNQYSKEEGEVSMHMHTVCACCMGLDTCFAPAAPALPCT